MNPCLRTFCHKTRRRFVTCAVILSGRTLMKESEADSFELVSSCFLISGNFLLNSYNSFCSSFMDKFVKADCSVFFRN